MFNCLALFSGGRHSVLPTSLRAQFPDNREKYREFRKTKLPAAPEAPNSADAIGPFDPIPYVPKQGISEARTGKQIFRTGKLSGVGRLRLNDDRGGKPSSGSILAIGIARLPSIRLPCGFCL